MASVYFNWTGETPPSIALAAQFLGVSKSALDGETGIVALPDNRYGVNIEHLAGAILLQLLRPDSNIVVNLNRDVTNHTVS